jgi:phage shock protein A
VPALRKFWSENQSARSALEKGDKKLYEEVLSNFKQHADTLETKGEAA